MRFIESPFETTRINENEKTHTMKKTFIMLLLGIISFTKTSIQAQDTLSLEKAIQLSIKNRNLGTENSENLARQEVRLISDVYYLYQRLSYYQEYDRSLTDLEKLVSKKLEENRKKAPDKNAFQLYSGMILTEFEIRKNNNQKQLIKTRTLLNEKLNLKGNYYLKSNIQPVQSITSSNKRFDQSDSLAFNNHVDYTQQLNVKAHLMRQLIIKELNEFDFGYPELLNILNQYFEAQHRYYSNIIELENEYARLIGPMFVRN